MDIISFKIILTQSVIHLKLFQVPGAAAAPAPRHGSGTAGQNQAGTAPRADTGGIGAAAASPQPAQESQAGAPHHGGPSSCAVPYEEAALAKILTGACKKDGDSLFSRVCCDRKRGDDFKWKEGDLD